MVDCTKQHESRLTMPFEWLINAFATLFVIVDPIGLAPIFLVVTAGMSREDRAAVAWRAALVATGILVTFALVGNALLAALGITLSAFRIAGGLLLFYTAFEMIFEKRHERKKKTAKHTTTKSDIQNIAVFPLAIPLMAGPGAISATVLLASERSTLPDTALLVALLCVITGMAYVVFRLADKIDPLLGDSGRTLLGRLLGVLLAALSVQFVVDGIAAIVADIPA
ncbi:MAG: MarC family protein [Pseudomonadota bacterium]